MPDILPAPEGLWAIVAIYPDTETVELRNGDTFEFNAGEPELGISPVIGFERDSDDAFYPLVLHSDGSFAEILSSNSPPYSFEAYVLTSGSPFIPCGLGKSLFTPDNLPDEYRHLLAASDPAPQSDAPRIEKVAQSVYVKLTQRGALTESGVRRLCGAEQKPYLRDALRLLEDQGRAAYDGTRWHAKFTPMTATDTGKDT